MAIPGIFIHSENYLPRTLVATRFTETVYSMGQHVFCMFGSFGSNSGME